jgi:ligand-binding SRPBCC domain-containing protein
MLSCVYQLKTKLWLPASCPSVFALFADAFKLEDLTPPFLGFRVVTPEPIDMKLGRLIDYRLKLHGLPIGWRTEITEWEPPFRFEDSQIRGPYSMWIHSHTFEESGSGTLVRDSVRYSVPGGPLIHALMVKRDLRRIFEYRCAQLPRLLGFDPTECEAGEVEISRLAEASADIRPTTVCKEE